MMLCVVPLVGLGVFGNAKQAWAYTRDWLRVIGLLIAAAVIVALVMYPLTPPPQ